MIKCYLLDVREKLKTDPGKSVHLHFGRVAKSGKLTSPGGRRGPTVFATVEEIDEAIERVARYMSAQNKFGKLGEDQIPELEFVAVAVLVPIKTMTIRTSFEIPIQDAV